MPDVFTFFSKVSETMARSCAIDHDFHNGEMA
jgi:hypothetical protein